MFLNIIWFSELTFNLISLFFVAQYCDGGYWRWDPRENWIYRIPLGRHINPQYHGYTFCPPQCSGQDIQAFNNTNWTSFNDFSILLVLVDGDASSQNLCIPCPPPCICCIGPGAILSYQCILISLQLDKNWRWLFRWQQLVTNTNDPFIHDVNSVSLPQRSCIDGLNLGLKFNKIGHIFLSFMAQKLFNMIWEIVMTVTLRAAVQ